MNKLLLLSLSGVSLCANALFNYQAFQHFDNRVSFGTNYGQGTLSTNNATNSNTYNYNSINVEVEKLFDVGIWLDGQIGNLNTYEQNGTTLAPLGSYQYLATANLKLGYNFPIVENSLSITPYFLIGKNANINFLNNLVTTYNIVAPGVTGLSNYGITQNYYVTTGLGLRLEYPINKYFDVFFDQFVAYNADQAPLKINTPGLFQGVNSFNGDTSNTQYTSTLGLKVDLWDDLQLGANLFYTAYTGYGTDTLAFYNNPALNNYATGLPTTDYGAQFQVGWTFQ
jgi:hypothetical protein